MNFYCQFIGSDCVSALYAVGISRNELNGIVRFFINDEAPVVVKMWSDYDFSKYRIYSINRKYRDLLSNAEFPLRMAWEVG